MKGKYYIFTEGQNVPQWLFKADFKKMGRKYYFHNTHHGKIIFGRSCIVIRGDEKTYSKVMPMNNTHGEKGTIRIRGFNKATIGGVDGATGVCMPSEGGSVANLCSGKIN